MYFSHICITYENGNNIKKETTPNTLKRDQLLCEPVPIRAHAKSYYKTA